MYALEHPRDGIIWLNAIDPAQPWGKLLKHRNGRNFLNVAGTAVALRAGVPAAVLERQGKSLRIFEWNDINEILRAFTQDYAGHRIFLSQNRIVVKDYPKEAAEALRSAGFIHELQDYVIYR